MNKQKKTILITGGSGFLGKALAKAFKHYFNVVLGARNSKQNAEAQSITGCPVVSLDVSRIESVRDVVNSVKPDIIIHAAATKFVDLSEKYPLDCVDINIVGSQNVARVAIDKKVGVVIGISSDKASPPVKGMYGMSKAVMEKMFCNLDGETRFACVRYGNVAWSTGSVLPKWKEAVDNGHQIMVCNTNMRRFFFRVEDAVSLVVSALDNIKDVGGKILAIEMHAENMGEVAREFGKFYGARVREGEDRPGERIDEYLIGESEAPYTKRWGKFLLLSPKETASNPLTVGISTLNAPKMTHSELIDLFTE